jgi:hypothetical protein
MSSIYFMMKFMTPTWGSLTKRTVCPTTPLDPLLLAVYKGNIDFNIANDILYNTLNS